MISALSSGERNWLPRMTSTHHSLGIPQSRTLCLSSWNSGTSLFHSIFFISSCCGNWTSRTTILRIFVTHFGLPYKQLCISTNLHLNHPTALGYSCTSWCACKHSLSYGYQDIASWNTGATLRALISSFDCVFLPIICPSTRQESSSRMARQLCLLFNLGHEKNNITILCVHERFQSGCWLTGFNGLAEFHVTGKHIRYEQWRIWFTLFCFDLVPSNLLL